MKKKTLRYFNHIKLTQQTQGGIDRVWVVMDIEEALHSTKSDTKGYENHNKHRGFGKPAQASEQLVAIAGTAGTWDHKSEYARIGLDTTTACWQIVIIILWNQFIETSSLFDG